ncbi:MAG: anaerobic ribonucleoside-triphosphate reductase activating protein [Holosporales bacterium]|jgi:pyruvate formate lyase activating enzyme|nr:anaerobic ribonucleoside-triphosphate reductase activating protein [Holosporales bacterium]
MKIAAILKFSALDYPGKLSGVVFCQGCPLRCGYCHNPNFLDPSLSENVLHEEFLSFLKNRVGLLEAIVFSGGEPLLQPDLMESIKLAKDLGYSVGIHTSGIIPDALKSVLPMLDWVGLDVKTCFELYENITNTPGSGNYAAESLDIILASGVNYEARTTYDSRNITESDLINIARVLGSRGVHKWVIQECIIRGDEPPIPIPLPPQTVLSEIATYIHVELRRS